MPNRYVRESAIESERVNSLSWIGEAFFRRLINRVDDFGRFTGNEHLLRASIFPLKIDKVSAKDVKRLIEECHKAGLVYPYKGDDGKDYIVMNSWERGRAKESKYPPPPDETLKQMKTHVYGCLQTSADPPDSDSDSDSDTDTDNSCPPKSDGMEILSKIWEMSPPRARSRSSKKQVATEWRKIKSKDRPKSDEVIASFQAWLKSDDWIKDGGEFVPGLHLWFKHERWQDSPKPITKQADPNCGISPL